MIGKAIGGILVAIISIVIYKGYTPEQPIAYGDVARNDAFKKVPLEEIRMIRNSRGYFLFGRFFKTTKPLKATVFVFHGWAEHMLRHKALIDDLNENGYEVYALDHQGHGLSDGPIAFDASLIVDDAAQFIQQFQDKSKKNYILGHSMGGLISTTLALRKTYKLKIDGVILSGAAVQADDKVATPFLRKISGVVGVYLPCLPVVPPLTAKISKDPNVRRAYDADPLVYHGGIPAKLGMTMLQLQDEVSAKFDLFEYPVLALHGEVDALVPVKGSELLINQASSADKKIIIIDDGWHEIFHDKPVRKHVIDWLNARN